MGDSSAAASPLQGIRVLELGSFVAGPFATRIFGDFGAEVIKVERPEGGDEIRGWRNNGSGNSMMFRTLGRNKKSVTLDLKSAEGREALLGLVRRSDVVVENFRPGTLEGLGLGPDELTAANADLIMVRISGYGQTGPYRDRAGFGGVAEAFGGLRYITGYPDRPAVRPAAPIGDVLAGLYGAVSALMLLLARARGLRHAGPRVADVALYEAVFMAMDSLIPDMDAYGFVRKRTAGNLPGVVPSGAFQTGDGETLLIAGNSSGAFKRLMTAVGRPDLAADPTLVDADARFAREAEIDDAITAWASTCDIDEAVEALSVAGVPAGPVLDARGIARDVHYEARDMFQKEKVNIDGEKKEVRFPGVVPLMPGAPGAVRWVGPELGAHTEEVLGDLLGLTPEQLADYRARKVI